MTAKSETVGVVAWRCFHCDEVFTDREAASLHFGDYGPRSYTDAHCLIDAPKLRDMEFQLQRYQEEDGPIHRLMHRQASEHTQALQRAEEAGYAKALKDTNYSEDAEAKLTTLLSGLEALAGEWITQAGDYDQKTESSDCQITKEWFEGMSESRVDCANALQRLV
jgi:hypothetical protein